MIRLYVPHDLAAGAELALDPGQSRYLAAVMRQAVGAGVRLFNGRDGEWRATIAAVTKRAVAVRADRRERPQHLGPALDLIVAVGKRGRLGTHSSEERLVGKKCVRNGT